MSYIYLIGPEDGPFKIGISTRPENRAKQLQTGHPRPVAVHGCWRHAKRRAVEAEVHRLLAPWHVSGEWFDVSINRAKTAIMQAISRVNSGNHQQSTVYNLPYMRDVIMPSAAQRSDTDDDRFRLGYARRSDGLDLACQVAWLEACGVPNPDIYIETEPRTNSALKRAFREFREGDRFLVVSRQVLGGSDQVQALFQIAKKRHVTVQFVDEVVPHTIMAEE